MHFKIREAREAAGYSQKELAAIIGVAQNTLHGYESGKHDPKSELLIKIAQACNVTVDFLLGVDTESIRRGTPATRTVSPSSFLDDAETLYGEQTAAAFDMYLRLDTGDRGEIRGEMKHMLRDEKYAQEKERLA